MKISAILSAGIAMSLSTMSASAHGENILERIAVAVLADKFGIDTREVIVLQQQTRLPVYELAPVLEGAYYFKQRPTTVWQLRQQGLGWGQIAQRVGMHPGQFNKLRKSGAFDEDRFWSTSYRERFGIPDSQIVVLRQRGGTLEDVLAAIIIGKLTNKAPQDVYNRYTVERSWTTISAEEDIRFEQWRRVSVPVRTTYRLAGPKSGSSDRGRATSGAKSDSWHKGGKDQDDRSEKKGGSEGQGRGNGKGKSKGKGKGG
jgi:hypothetical protein